MCNILLTYHCSSSIMPINHNTGENQIPFIIIYIIVGRGYRVQPIDKHIIVGRGYRVQPIDKHIIVDRGYRVQHIDKHIIVGRGYREQYKVCTVPVSGWAEGRCTVQCTANSL